jgi:two-component system sensor histidine kinase YesM
MKKLSNNGVLLFRTQLYLAFLPLTVLPLAIVGYFSYTIASQALQTRSIANVGQISSLANQNLDSTVQQAIQLAKTPLYDAPFQQIITYYSQHPEVNAETIDFQNTQYIRNFALNILIHNNNIASVDIYTLGTAVFSESFYGLQPLSDWRSQPWFATLIRVPTHTLILPTHPLQGDPQAEFGNRSVFSIAQAVVNTNTFQPVGVIMINISTQQAIERIINSFVQDPNTLFLIYAPNAQKIYITPQRNGSGEDSREQDALHDVAQQALQQGKNQITWKQTAYFLSRSTSSPLGLTIITLVPSASLTKDIEAIKQITFLMICLTIIAILGSSFFLVTRLSRQITQLRHLMMQVATGNLDVRFQSQGRGEIALLGQNFNQMVIHLKQLIQDNYESQLQRKKAELAALQSQLNPHFLYNILGTFQMLALVAGQKRLANMSYSLGQLMRYALGADTLVDLGQELAHAQHFLSLIKERYEERLHILVQIPEELLGYKMPKFTLQPLIENAIYHGIDPKIEGGTVQIRGYQCEQQLVVEIIDDGVGMAMIDLQHWQEALRYESNIWQRSKHIGILNVQGQIQRLFGPAYGLTIEAGEGCGLKVILSLPLCE